MSASDSQSTDQLDFVTMQGLLTYGEVLAQRTSSGRFVLPPPPPPAADRLPRAEEAKIVCTIGPASDGAEIGRAHV